MPMSVLVLKQTLAPAVPSAGQQVFTIPEGTWEVVANALAAGADQLSLSAAHKALNQVHMVLQLSCSCLSLQLHPVVAYQQCAIRIGFCHISACSCYLGIFAKQLRYTCRVTKDTWGPTT